MEPPVNSKPLVFPVETFSQTTVKPLKTENMKQKLDELGKTATNFLISADSSVQKFGADTLQALIDIENKWNDQPDDIEGVNQAIRVVVSEVNKYEQGLKQAEVAAAKLKAEQAKAVQQQAVEPLKLDNAINELEKLKAIATEFTTSATTEGQNLSLIHI